MKTLAREELRATLMAYIHGEFPNYEPVLRDLLEFEQALYEENLGRNGGAFQRGRRAEKTWHLVFEEPAGMLTPLQTEQLVDRLTKDFRSACDLFVELAQTQKLLLPDEGAMD
ncbi:MAG: hypothetical protein HY618_04195 [Candidatus Tectomicrobia bacterium]|uniref:Uncharacterized protein n=1 Tax=Tectimicrobiota bacterium TaxID=2528274 RepID=A0A932ZUK7_UNCTE|nr:hypothetical protein [Candidatus Tectomicrobia bacterium]